MATDQVILFSIFGVVFAMLLWGKFRYDLVAFSALLIGVVLNVVPPSMAFSGFGHPATVIVALVLVVSAGLVRSGAVFLITWTLVDSSRTLGKHIAFMGGIGALLSAFMNNVAALALLMPIDVQTAKKAGRSARHSLMPLSFCTILGGMITLIGTPPNIIIASFREERLGESFRMFDFAPVGAIVAIAGVLFVATLGWRLIPSAAGDGSLGTARETVQDYIAELKIPDDSKFIGMRLFETYETAEKNDVAVIGIIRSGIRRYGLQRNTKLEKGDALVVEAHPEALDEFRAALSLQFVDNDEQERLGLLSEGLSVVEAVVPENARIVGKTAKRVGLAWRQRTILLGISREGKQIEKEVRQTVVKPGDILLMITPDGHEATVTEWLGVLPLADRGLVVTDSTKVWLAIGLFGGAVLLAALGLLYLPVALGLVVVAYVFTGILPISDIYDHIEWPVVVLLGSMIPLGAALDESGGTAMIATSLLGLGSDWPAWALLTLLMVVTMTLSDVLNNTATAIVAAPVGLQMAESLKVSPDPFLMVVAVAASCAFLTPIGHKNNTLVLGPGGYSFSDYWRTGLPLEILVVATSIPAIMFFWPL